jgi:fructose-1,6-bisphosphatase/inositol monophosphatase family enzyme
MTDFEQELEVAKGIAIKAGDFMRRYFDGDQQQETKEDGSPVTIADKKINQLVIAALSRAYPNDGVIGEEASTSQHGMGRKWICDPIDGTKAFTWGVPTATFSLGLVIDGHPVLGVVYDPFLDMMYAGRKGQGSFCNDERLRVSESTLKDGVVAVASDVKEIMGLSYILNIPKPITFSGPIYKSVLVAKGRFVGFVEAGPTDHDMAAAQVIVQEAGGRVTNLQGDELNYTKPFAGVVVSNGVVHDELLRIINS